VNEPVCAFAPCQGAGEQQQQEQKLRACSHTAADTVSGSENSRVGSILA